MTAKQKRTLSAKKRTVYIMAAIVMGIAVAASNLILVTLGKYLNEVDYIHAATALIGAVFAYVLFIGCCFSFREDTPQGHALAAATVLIFLNILLSGVFDMLEGTAGMQRPLFILQTATSVGSLLINLLVWQYQCNSLPENRTRRYFSVLVACQGLGYIVLLIVNLFTPVLFYTDASGKMHDPGIAIEFGSFVLFYLTYLLYVLSQRCPLRKKLCLAGFAIFPLLGSALAIVRILSGTEAYATLASGYILLLQAAYVVFFGDYIESRELLLRQEAEIAERERGQIELQTELMLSQIRPHFLYNALTAIRSLCGDEQSQVYTALGQFADYLRGNMDILSGGRIISFKKELEHVKTYLMLEQLRFEDALRVEYDIRYEDFSLPALTVQPIVENAVRHGATANEDGGIVTVRTEKTDLGAVITVTDNGMGFDPAVPPSDGRGHYGLENVRACLAASGCGEMKIDSTPGAGTSVTITIWEGKG